MTELTTGYFLFSLDAELAWGHFDEDPDLQRLVAWRERRAIPRLLEILDEFQVVTTWGLVGHLYYDKCEECDVCPLRDWEGKYLAFEAVHLGGPDWYHLESRDRLLSPMSPHEIAFHGYTHKVFGDPGFTAADASLEIAEWKRAAGPNRPSPEAVIFPRNQAAHLDTFREAGFICYRGPILAPWLCSIPLVGRLLKRADLLLQVAEPVTYTPRVGPSGLVNLPASRRLLGMSPVVQRVLDAAHLSHLGTRRLVRGVERAARDRQVVHIVSHPYENFASEADFQRLRYLLSHVASLVNRGSLQSIGMSDLAALVLGRSAAVLRGPVTSEPVPA